MEAKSTRIGHLDSEELATLATDINTDAITYTRTSTGYEINFAGVTIGSIHNDNGTWIATSSDLIWVGSPIAYTRIATTGQETRTDTVADLIYFIANHITFRNN